MSTTLSYTDFVFSYAFVSTACTIISGAMAERIHFKAYFVFTAVVGSFIYPLIQRAFWYTGSQKGVFARWGEYGVIDFAGSGVVHMTGGTCGLLGAYYVGPRLNLERLNATPREPYKVAMSILGTFLLSVGWLSFNAGSTRTPSSATTGGNSVAALAAVNTLMAGAGGTMVSIVAFSVCRVQGTGENLRQHSSVWMI